MNRREFIKALMIGYMYNLIVPSNARSTDAFINYSLPKTGDIRLLHITDTHAQLEPIYFREPDVNLGVGSNKNMPPHLVSENFLNYYSINNNYLKYAFTPLNFSEFASQYGKLGGYAYLKTVVDNLRNEADGKALLLDGGDTWQGSGLSLFTNGEDMVESSNILGVDVMTGHWEFTYGQSQFIKNIKKFKGEFVAHNISLTEEAQFDGEEAYDDFGHFQKPYTIKKISNHRIAIIGQAFPYTPIANPGRFVNNLTFGIRENELQELVNRINQNDKPDIIVLLSHNGVDVDKKLASRVKGIDIILGGHTHDVIPKPIEIINERHRTIIINSGCSGKFLSVLDLDIHSKNSFDYRYNLLPIFSNKIQPSGNMTRFIQKKTKPFERTLNEVIGYSNHELYRRGTFTGSFDSLLCKSLNSVMGSEISLSPGFRWGTSLPKNTDIKMSDIYNQTAITYPNTYRRELNGSTLKNILEDVADNIFNPDPYMQQGGDMVRTAGLIYDITPKNIIGKRISNLRLSNGNLIDPNKNYVISGWASVNQIETGKPIWEVAREYLQNNKIYSSQDNEKPRILGESDNLGTSSS
jgi:sulfur-oxidizing protein SoxB